MNYVISSTVTTACMQKVENAGSIFLKAYGGKTNII